MRFSSLVFSNGARETFERLMPESARFVLPADAIHDGTVTLADTAARLAEWRKVGILPYRVISTEFAWRSEEGSYVERAVFYEEDGLLRYVVRTEVETDGKRTDVIGTYGEVPDGRLAVHAPTRLARGAKDDPDVRVPMLNELGTGLWRILWLVRALQSIEYTASKERLPRAERRAQGVPRDFWRILVRRKGARGVPTAKAIFAEVVRMAHAVRGHMRTHFRTGEKTIGVHPHIRGKGDMVQLRDYVVLEDDPVT